jgi:hypothetical protein
VGGGQPFCGERVGGTPFFNKGGFFYINIWVISGTFGLRTCLNAQKIAKNSLMGVVFMSLMLYFNRFCQLVSDFEYKKCIC